MKAHLHGFVYVCNNTQEAYTEISIGLFEDLTSSKGKILDIELNYPLKLKPKLNDIYDLAGLPSDTNTKSIKK